MLILFQLLHAKYVSQTIIKLKGNENKLKFLIYFVIVI